MRHNAITGAVQTARRRQPGKPRSTPTDPYAARRRPRPTSPASDSSTPPGATNGLLCARALVAPGPPIKGRLIVDPQHRRRRRGKKRIRERDLRQNVDWPGGALTPFVLKTNLTAPTEKNQKDVPNGTSRPLRRRLNYEGSRRAAAITSSSFVRRKPITDHRCTCTDSRERPLQDFFESVSNRRATGLTMTSSRRSIPGGKRRTWFSQNGTICILA